MKGTSVAAFGLLIMSVVPASLFAKGRTVKITIEGVGLSTPLEIADPEIGQFEVFAGPGTWVNGVEGHDGFIINWSNGIVRQLPAGLQRYEVSFYTGCRMNEYGCRSSNPSLAYVALYAYSPSINQGYIYLPGKTDEWHKFNRMWHGHDFEGNWGYATSAWESFVRPLIAKAKAASPSH